MVELSKLVVGHYPVNGSMGVSVELLPFLFQFCFLQVANHSDSDDTYESLLFECAPLQVQKDRAMSFIQALLDSRLGGKQKS